MKKNIKLFLSIILLIFTPLLTFANSDYEELDSIIAIVENDVITKKELKESLEKPKKERFNFIAPAHGLYLWKIKY